MRYALAWLITGLLTIFITALISMPAAWLVPLIDQQTAGRFSLAEVEGNLWQGSAVIGIAAARDEPLTALLPGRCSWHISPSLLFGGVNITLENSSVSAAPIRLRGSGTRWEIAAGSMTLHADSLAGLGAPLNTLQPAGVMKISWPALTLTREGSDWLINGPMQITLTSLSSRLSPLKPLGAYQLQFDWIGRGATLNLQSLSGPLMLTGRGGITNGHFHFSGEAWAQAGYETQLATLLGLLGQRRQLDDRIVTTLEFQ